MHRNNIIAILVLIILSSCNSGGARLKVDLSGVQLEELKIKRYGKDLFEIDTSIMKTELIDLAKTYPVFLNADLDDSLNIMQLYEFITDPQLIELNEACQELYPNLIPIEKEVSQALRYYKYYFPDQPIPDLYTYISGLHYEYPVQLGENNMLIGLDLYLGKNFEGYRQVGIPEYKIARMNAAHIVIDCMKELAFAHLPPQNVSHTFLDEIINNGKILYFLDAMMPDKEDHLKIGYTPEQIQWCKASESNLWTFFIENQMLYSSDFQLIKKFCMDGPFTAVLSNDSPGAVGNWVGWQIVGAYMDNNQELSLAMLFAETDAQKILTMSRYKPGR